MKKRCRGKVCYNSEQAAFVAVTTRLRYMYTKDDWTSFRAYRCVKCHCYHLTKAGRKPEKQRLTSWERKEVNRDEKELERVDVGSLSKSSEDVPTRGEGVRGEARPRPKRDPPH